jgi:putative hemolysin
VMSTIQIGITLANLLASATAAVTLARPLVEPLSVVFGAAAHTVAVVAITIALTYLTLVFGELAPKRIALQRAEGWAKFAARPLAFAASLSRPAVWLLSKSTDLVVRLVGGNPGQQREEVTQEEVRDMVTEQASDLDPLHRTILTGAFEIAERKIRDVLVPRPDVTALFTDLPVREGLQRLLDSGHARAPVYRGDLDDAAGIVHLADLVKADPTDTVGQHTRDAITLPETVEVLDALRRLQAERQQMAIVVNEYGGTEGVVTVEDLLEELVGEIWDEFDPDVATVQRQPDGSYVLPGTFPVHDLDDLGIKLPEGPYATLAGLVLERLGRLAEVGDTAEADGWRLEVLAVERRAIKRIRLTRANPTHPDDAPPDQDDREQRAARVQDR